MVDANAWSPPSVEAPYWRDRRGFRVCRNVTGQFYIMRPNGRVVLTTSKANKAETWRTAETAMQAAEEMES